MDEVLMTIREMCEAFDVTPRTLRFYESKELLFPTRIGQKRLFARRDRTRLKLILRGKRFGVSLEDMRQLLDLYKGEDGRMAQLHRASEIARNRLAAIRSEREQLQMMMDDLGDEIARLEGLMKEKMRQSAA